MPALPPRCGFHSSGFPCFPRTKFKTAKLPSFYRKTAQHEPNCSLPTPLIFSILLLKKTLFVDATMITVEENPALARKRRMEQRKRSATEQPDAAVSSGSAPNKRPCTEEDRLVPSIRGIKKTTRYEPGVPMTKEELKKWRKEARRVRNRESAAASRQKTRERIDELEGQVADLQAQLAAAHARIAQLSNTSEASVSVAEVSIKVDDHDHHPEDTDHKNQGFSTQVSPVSSPQVSPKGSPLYAPRAASPLMLEEAVFSSTTSTAPAPDVPSLQAMTSVSSSSSSPHSSTSSSAASPSSLPPMISRPTAD